MRLALSYTLEVQVRAAISAKSLTLLRGGGLWRAATRPVAGRYAACGGRYAAWFQGRYAANELT